MDWPTEYRLCYTVAACNREPTMPRANQRLSAAFAGLVLGVTIVASAPARGQMIGPTLELLGPPPPPTSAMAPGLLDPPTGVAPPQSDPRREVIKVAPIKRVIPKTPPLPTAVSRTLKSSATPSRSQSASAVAALPKPMAVGAATADRTRKCGPGQTLVRKMGQCERRPQVAAGPKASSAKTSRK